VSTSVNQYVTASAFPLFATSVSNSYNISVLNYGNKDKLQFFYTAENLYFHKESVHYLFNAVPLYLFISIPMFFS
ncbi:hypothetical protein, partial [Dysgonomonas sp. UBA7698]